MDDKKENIESKIEQIFIDKVNAERKKEEDFIKFEESQEDTARYLKIVYDSYISQGFKSDNAIYLTGLFYQSISK